MSNLSSKSKKSSRNEDDPELDISKLEDAIE